MSTHSHRCGTIRLGDIEYHPDTGKLTRATGEEVFLRAQTAHVLRVLSKNAGNLVSKDHLISEVWRDVHVTDDSLTQCISGIRRAIGDKTREILQTVPKRGFVLHVSAGEGVPLQSGPMLQEAGASAGHGDRRAAVPAGFGSVGRIAPPGRIDDLARPPWRPRAPAAGALQPRPDLVQTATGNSGRGGDPLPTIAIIPVRAIGGAPGHDVVGEVVADDVISALSRSEEVNVTSRLSTTVFKWRDIQLGAIGRALNADFVMSGSIAGDAEDVVLRLELAEVGTNQVLWSDRIDARLPSLLAETDVSQKIVSGVRRSIELREIRRVKSNRLGSLRNYSLLTGAVGLMHRLAPADFAQARTLLETLVERSPDHPSPLAWMARWHVLRVQQGWSPSPQQDAEAALDCAKRALDIDPDNVLALTNSGFVLTNLLHSADSDGTGHPYRFEGGHVFRSDAGRRSDLMPAT